MIHTYFFKKRYSNKFDFYHLYQKYRIFKSISCIWGKYKIFGTRCTTNKFDFYHLYSVPKKYCIFYPFLVSGENTSFLEHVVQLTSLIFIIYTGCPKILYFLSISSIWGKDFWNTLYNYKLKHKKIRYFVNWILAMLKMLFTWRGTVPL